MENHKPDKRTIPQNKSIHKWFRMIAEELNAAGYTVNSHDVFKLDVPFTEFIIKELMFKRIMTAMYPDKTSTAKLTKEELSEIANVLHLHLAEKMGIYVPFPSEETMINKES